MWQNSWCIITVRHSVHCANGKKWQRQFTYQLFSLITGIKTIMLLIIFLGLISKLALSSGKCEHGNLKVKDFDWNKVGISVWHNLYNNQLFKLCLGLYFIYGYIKGLSVEYIRMYIRVIEWSLNNYQLRIWKKILVI